MKTGALLSLSLILVTAAIPLTVISCKQEAAVPTKAVVEAKFHYAVAMSGIV
ncbi:MAG: hypothetical protein ACI9MB_005364 [Verrucomicrobiales bacterium]|jgi:hypothetical protein